MEKYLLVSAMPTPNGGLHLGHLAAQFLPQDIFKRYQRRQGKCVAFYGGFDVYDNAISLEAKKNNLTPQEMALHFQKLIKSELDYFHIDIDELINYLDPELIRKSHSLIAKISENLPHLFSRRSILYPYSSQHIPIAGNRLAGKCKKCHKDIKGYSCDNCGTSITPDDIYDFSFQSADQYQKVSWQPKDIMFLSVPPVNLINYIHQQKISDSIKSFCINIAMTQKVTYQWTAVDEWGIFLHPGQDDEVFFNRNFTLIEQLIIAEMYESKFGENPFVEGTDINTILAYGKDNAGLLMVDLPHIALATSIVSPYKYHWVSHFYCLEGRKMSTSQNFAIWLNDLILSGIDADAIRIYLCSRFSVEEDIDLDLNTIDEHDKFIANVKKDIVSMFKLEGEDPSNTDLTQAMIATSEKVQNVFSHTQIDLKEYYIQYKNFCSYIYCVNCKSETELWISLFDRYFSAMTPGLANYIDANRGVTYQ